jgi:hypothetical protein
MGTRWIPAPSTEKISMTSAVLSLYEHATWHSKLVELKFCEHPNLYIEKVEALKLSVHEAMR